METKRMTALAVPNVIVCCGFFLPQVVAASFIGRNLNTEALAGYTLGNLAVNICTYSFLWGLSFTNDTLGPQAYGAQNYREVGLLSMRGFVVAAVLVLPFNIIVAVFLERILLWVGEPAIPAMLATEYYQIFLWSVPFFILYMMQWKFLICQELVRPVVTVVLISCVIVLPLSLSWLIGKEGFAGAPMALNIVTIAEAVLLLLYLIVVRPHRPETWQKLWSSSSSTGYTRILSVWSDALSWDAVLLYVKLGTGGILSKTEWWFWEILVMVIGTFGVVPLNVHTIAIQTILLFNMICRGLGIALSVRIGNLISTSVPRAKKLLLGTYVATAIILSIVITMLHVFRFSVFGLFTRSPAVIEVRVEWESTDCWLIWCLNCVRMYHLPPRYHLTFAESSLLPATLMRHSSRPSANQPTTNDNYCPFQSIDKLWWKVLLYYLSTGITIVNSFALFALGLQWFVGWTSTIILWVFNFPAVLYFAVWRGGGIEAAWTTLIPCFMAIAVIFFWRIFTFDWDAFGEQVRLREERSKVIHARNDATAPTDGSRRALVGQDSQGGKDRDHGALLNETTHLL